MHRSENEQESFQVAQVPPFHLFKTTKAIYFSFVEFYMKMNGLIDTIDCLKINKIIRKINTRIYLCISL